MNTKKNEVEERTFNIEGGPNKDRLTDAFKYAFDKSAGVKVDFAVAIGYTGPEGSPGRAYILMNIYDIKILGIEHESSSGESLNLYGNCMADLDTISVKKAVYKRYKFKAYYDSQSRKGKITFFS